MSILPGEDTVKTLFGNYKVHFGRTIVKILPAFKFLKKNVPGHIRHPFSKEMATKSEQVHVFHKQLHFWVEPKSCLIGCLLFNTSS